MPEIDTRPSVEVPLKFPFSYEATEYKSLTMRRPKMKDTLVLSALGPDDTKRAVRLMSLLCNVSDDVIGELDEVDVAAVQKQYVAFTGRQPDKTN